MSHHRLAIWIRVIGILVIASAVLLCAAQVYALIHTPRANLLDYGARALAYLALGTGLGSVLVALATVVGTRVDPTGAFLASLQHLQQQVDQLSMRIGTLASNLDSERRGSSEMSPLLEPDAMLRIEEMLREIRELSLLGDSDRRVRLSHHLEQRKRFMSRQIMELVNAHEYAKAEQVLLDLESQFPGDVHAVGCRRDLEAARRETESKLVREARERVEHLMALSSWDQALGAVNHLVENFPKNADARDLLGRVARERDVFIDTNAQTLYTELRRHIEQHQWRSALAGAQKLLSKYPMHPRAQQMRQQLRTIQENADIEERQEAEVQIQELIRAGQFRDAIDVAEEIIRRFPGSPQADAIEAMLPRLQELAGEPQEPVA
jgi:tetratricopeptide (TPR) repeat protein